MKFKKLAILTYTSVLFISFIIYFVSATTRNGQVCDDFKTC